jgi:F-type H+-transporting ATPase subunit b
LSGILANGASLVLLAEEESVWKRIFNLDAQTLFDTSIMLISMLVLFTLMSYLLFNPARALIKKRQEMIEKDIEDAKKDKAEAMEFKKEYDEKLGNVKSEAEELLGNARRKAKKQESDIINEAHEEAGRIIKRAEKEAALEKNRVQDEMKQEIIAVASAMAGKMIEVSMDEKTQNELIETTLKEMGEETWQS